MCPQSKISGCAGASRQIAQQSSSVARTRHTSSSRHALIGGAVGSALHAGNGGTAGVEGNRGASDVRRGAIGPPSTPQAGRVVRCMDFLLKTAPLLLTGQASRRQDHTPLRRPPCIKPCRPSPTNTHTRYARWQPPSWNRYRERVRWGTSTSRLPRRRFGEPAVYVYNTVSAMRVDGEATVSVTRDCAHERPFSDRRATARR